MEKIVENIKQIYAYDTWKRRKIETDSRYFPVMLKLPQTAGFVIERSIAPVPIIGAYETTWKAVENSNIRFRVEVIPFDSMEEADECVLSKLCGVSVMLPRVDSGDNEDRIIFGDQDRILIGRECNVYWCMQNLCAEKANLIEFQNELLRAVAITSQDRQ